MDQAFTFTFTTSWMTLDSKADVILPGTIENDPIEMLNKEQKPFSSATPFN
jgi:hypothetical protein